MVYNILEAVFNDIKESVDDLLMEFKKIKRDIHQIKMKLGMYKEEDMLD